MTTHEPPSKLPTLAGLQALKDSAASPKVRKAPASGGKRAEFGSFRKVGVPYYGVLKIRILLFRVLYQGPLFSETPIRLPASLGLLDRDINLRCRVRSDPRLAVCPSLLWAPSKLVHDRRRRSSPLVFFCRSRVQASSHGKRFQYLLHGPRML